MLIKTIPVGQLETNCYVVTNEATLECVVIDPGDESNAILDYIEDNHLKCRAVMLTHGHFEETGATVYMNHRDDARENSSAHLRFTLPENGKSYDDGDVIEAASMRFEVMATPGHTPGGVTLKCGDALFTGDTLFKGSCGRTDLDGGDMAQELASLKKICALPGDFEVYPGHMDPTSLERERLFNYYCREAMNKY